MLQHELLVADRYTLVTLRVITMQTCWLDLFFPMVEYYALKSQQGLRWTVFLVMCKEMALLL